MDYSGKIITKNPVEPSQTSAPGVWTLDQATQAVQGNNWPIAYVPNPISRSLRFNSADSTKLTRTPASAGNRKTWTFSAWIKRSTLSATQGIFHCYDGSSSRRSSIQFNSDNTIGWDQGGDGSSGLIDTVAVYRDVSAWYHLVCVADYSNGTAANRAKIYINNVLQTVTTTDDFENADGLINSTNQHQIGSVDTVSYFNGYFTEINFIDGQALDASYFGMTDPRTGAWIPKKYSGTYGTNGFYLNFSDNASTAALGTDYSGNSNTWTTNNFSVTTGSGNDSMTDVPTPWIPYNTTGDVGGVVRGNYCTLNPLTTILGSSTLSDGNLKASVGSNSWWTRIGTTSITTGKWYFEYTAVGSGTVDQVVGWATSNYVSTASEQGNYQFSLYATSAGNGQTITNASYSNKGSSWFYTFGDTVMIAFDADANKIWFGKNGSWFGSGNPAGGTNEAGGFSSASYITQYGATPIVHGYWAASTPVLNFGQRPFAYTPPAGFKSLCTTNLPEPTVLDGGDYMNAVTFTGNGSTQSITGVGFQPDFVWIKARNQAGYGHELFDSVRGATKYLISNSTGAETTEATSLTAFNSDGFSLGSWGFINASGDAEIAWNWKAGGTPAVTNTAGTITSTVSANQTAGFAVATTTGAGGAGTIGHGLGAVPQFIMCFRRNTSADRYCYHQVIGNTNYLVLNTTAASAASSNMWNNTTPTSTVFSVGNSNNNSGDTYVHYIFAPISGYSAFGSYTGNGSTDGPFVYTGFRARYILIKRSDAIDDWFVYDTARSPYNAMTYVLSPNSNAAESSTTNPDDLSNGFKIRSSSGGTNASGGTYIYACFAENPFKYSNAR